MDVLRRLFPDSPQLVHVVENTKDGLLLSNGWLLDWPDDETGVVLLFDTEGDIFAEWWPGEPDYGELVDFFKAHPGKHDIVQRPRLRLVHFDEESSE